MKISQKGLILVGVPLLFELVVFSSMLFLLAQTEQTAKRAVVSRQVLDALYTVINDYLDLRTILSRLKWDNGTLNSRLMQNELAKLKGDTEMVANCVGDSLAGVQFARSLNERVNQVAGIMSKVMSSQGDMRFEYIKQVSANLSSPVDLTQASGFYELVGKRSAAENTELKLQVKLLDSLEQMIILGAIFGVVTSIALAVFFVFEITRRTRAISKNLDCLSKGQPMRTSISGTDELVRLDLALRQMASEIQSGKEQDLATQRFREDVIRMATHDMRTPLQNVLAFFEFMELRPQSGSAQLTIQGAENNARKMALLINNLLDLEKVKHTGLTLDSAKMSMREAASQAIEETLEPERRTMVTIEGDATVYADEPRIVQTFKNLIHAVSFPWSEGQSMNVRITTQTDKVVVNVTANRTPAAESAVARPVDRAGDTSGKELGLELSRTLIELHGGTLKSTARSPSCEQYSFAIPFHPPPFNSALEEEEW